MIASVLLSVDLFYYFTTKQELQNVEDLFPCVHSRDSDYSTLTLELLNWQIMRFFSNAHKPMILALARPDPKKNITTLVKAFGECRPLRELANLVS